MEPNRRAALAAVMALLGTACGEDVTAPPPSGAVRVTVTTSGLDLDLDGYRLRFDAGPSQAVAMNAVIVTDLTPGWRIATLDGVAANCGVRQVSPQPVDVVAEDTTDVAITVECTSTLTVVSVGYLYACGVTATGAAYCWGFNGFGQLGDGTGTAPRSCANDYPCSPLPIPVVGGHSFSSVTTGHNHACGLTPAGAAYCWGLNLWGQLGDGTTTDRVGPVRVLGELSFAVLTAGAGHTCGLTTAGKGYCWGQNTHGELGDFSTIDRTSPVAVANGFSFGDISAGSGHTCAVSVDGAAYCWGDNRGGQLGDASTAQRTAPVAVVGTPRFRTVSAGSGHSCGVATSETAYCWGSNVWGALGDGTRNPSTSPVAVRGGLSFVKVSAGRDHSCGVTVERIGYCWGWNYAGQLGDNSRDERSTPTTVAGQLSFAVVTAGGGGWHTCGVTTNGVTYCWGDNSYGELGIGKMVVGENGIYPEVFSRVPVKVAGQP